MTEKTNKQVYIFYRVTGINSHNIYTLDKRHVEEELLTKKDGNLDIYNLMEFKSKIILFDDYETNSCNFADVVYDKTFNKIIGFSDVMCKPIRNYRIDADYLLYKKNPCACIFTLDEKFMKNINENTTFDFVYAEKRSLLALFINN